MSTHAMLIAGCAKEAVTRMERHFVSTTKDDNARKSG